MPGDEGGVFEPPAPVVRVVVRGPNGLVYNDAPFLIDTGADVSLVPQEVVNAVKATTTASSAPIQLLAGYQLPCVQADLSIEFLRYRFRGLFLVAESDFGVLGRNILNMLVVNLDGPGLFWAT